MIHKILMKQGNGRGLTIDKLQSMMVFNPDDKRDFHVFLNKFSILEEIKWDEWAIIEAMKQVCWHVVREKLDYVELKFSIDKYVKHNGWTPKDVISLIYSVVDHESSRWGFDVALILSLKYESDRDLQKNFASIISDDKIVEMLGGIDLVGDEAFFNYNFYQPIFKEWKQAGKGLEAHVGETQSAENVRLAVEELGIDRIAHGVVAADYPDVLDLVKERDVCFDVALTSNLCTGVINDYKFHPILKLINYGCKVTIGTDDPMVLNTTLDNEYDILARTFSLLNDQIMEIMSNSIKYAFTDLDLPLIHQK